MPNEQKETLLCRTEMLLGREGMQKLAQAHVAVFGIGGVGSFAAEALIRSGIGACLLYTSNGPTGLPSLERKAGRIV